MGTALDVRDSFAGAKRVATVDAFQENADILEARLRQKIPSLTELQARYLSRIFYGQTLAEIARDNQSTAHNVSCVCRPGINKFSDVIKDRNMDIAFKTRMVIERAFPDLARERDALRASLGMQKLLVAHEPDPYFS